MSCGKKILIHLITSLDPGGAQTVLGRLLGSMNSDVYESIVVALRKNGTYLRRIEGKGVRVISGNMDGPADMLHGLYFMQQIIKEEKPDLICSWMYHANAAAVVSSFIGRKIPIIWNIRHSLHDIKSEKRSTAVAIRTGKYFSRFADHIIYNSEVSRRQHERYGYRSGSSIVIPNGFDCDLYRPDNTARGAFRAELGLSDDALLVGHVARYHPMKDHANMLSAAALVAGRIDNAHFIFIGHGVDSNNKEMAQLIIENGMSDRVHLFGDLSDMHAVYPAFDLLVSSSYGEGFPNVVAEAMACGVPCVVTDVGDSGTIVGDSGRVVPPRSSELLAKAITDLIEMPPENRHALGLSARRRIVDNYSLDKMVSNYELLFRQSYNGLNTPL